MQQMQTIASKTISIMWSKLHHDSQETCYKWSGYDTIRQQRTQVETLLINNLERNSFSPLFDMVSQHNIS